MMRYFLRAVLAWMPTAFALDVYQEPQAFVREVFDGEVEPRVLWITPELRPAIREIMGHDLDVMRVRYWLREGRVAWVLEEVGKERLITAGVVVSHGKIERIKTLIYRESRGSEVRYPFFTDQFKGAALTPEKQLNKSIDGISGATLSVRALTKISRLALYLTQRIGASSDAS
jgi:hypothetical protein